VEARAQSRILPLLLTVSGAIVLGAGAALLAEEWSWRSDSRRREYGTAPTGSRPPAAETGKQRRPGEFERTLAAFAAAGAGSRAPSPTAIEIPELDPLILRSLEDRGAAAIRLALHREVSARVHANPPCSVAESLDRTQFRLEFDVSTPSENSAAAALSAPPHVLAGAPLPPSVAACVTARLSPFVFTPDEGRLFQPGFAGKAHVSVRLP
jgi:hypothetical protein